MIDKRVIDQLLSDRDLMDALEWRVAWGLARRFLPWMAVVQGTLFIAFWIALRIFRP